MSIKMLKDVLLKYNDHPEFLGEDLVDVNQSGMFDETPLHIASRKGEVEDVEILLANGANVNVVGDIGNTPLHQAALTGRCNVIQLLLKLGADPKLKNEFNQTPLEVAILGSHEHAAKILREVEKINK